MISLFTPIGIVVVGVIIVLALVVAEELQIALEGVDVGIGSEHLGSIETILRGIHHLRQSAHHDNACTDVGIDAGSHRMTTLGGDEDDTISTLGTIESSTVLHDLNLLDIGRIDVQEEVGIVAIVESGTRLLHVTNDTINNDEGLCIGVERAETANEHGRAVARTARAVDGMDIGTKVVFDFGLGRIGRSVVDQCLSDSSHIGAILIHGLELIGNHRDVELLVARSDAYLLTKISRCMHKQRCCECGHLDGELTLLVGHGSIVAVIERLYLDTSEGFFRYSIDDDTLHFHGGILGLLHLYFLLDDSFLYFFDIFHIVLGHCRQADNH